MGGVGRASGLRQRIKRIGLNTGPLFALPLLYFSLPHEYRAADGTSVEFGHAGRATFAAMGWMATWWMTEAVEIEVTSLLPIALFPLSRGERATLAVFGMTVLLWITTPLLKDLEIGGVAPLRGLSDAGIAIIAAGTLFLISVDRERGETLMDWSTSVRLPRGVLELFGGGLALASATEANGAPGFIGSLAVGFAGWPFWAILLASIAIMVFMSELTSNTAQVATLLPILAGLAPVLGVPARVLPVPATIAARCACMMPVGTPPNAIVFGTGLVRMPKMMKAGLWLSLTGTALIFGLTNSVCMPVLRGLR